MSDLNWMREVHIPDVIVGAPLEITFLLPKADKTNEAAPHVIAFGSGVVIAHRGKLDTVVKAAVPSDVADWCRQAFFDVPVRITEIMSLEGFMRWAKFPDLKLTTCNHCSGTGREPGGTVTDTELELCRECEGLKQIEDRAGAYINVGPAHVDRYGLPPITSHLRASVVAVGFSPALGGGVGFDAHVRAARTVGGKGTILDGDWRLYLPGVEL